MGGNVVEKVEEHIVERLSVKKEMIAHDAKLFDDLGADDLDRVELVMALEEEFGIFFTDEEAEMWVTVGNVIEAVLSKIAEKEGPAVQKESGISVMLDESTYQLQKGKYLIKAMIRGEKITIISSAGKDDSFVFKGSTAETVRTIGEMLIEASKLIEGGKK